MSDEKIVQLFPDEETLHALMALISFEREGRENVTIADVTRRILENHLDRLVEIGVVQKSPGITPEHDRFSLPEDVSLEEIIEEARAKANVSYPLREEALRRYATGIPVRINIEDLSEADEVDNN